MTTTKKDSFYLAVLTAVCILIGVLLISTTVLIADDGAVYIRKSQDYNDNPRAAFKSANPGYPFILWVHHKIWSSFNYDNRVVTAQIATLICRTLSLIPLYFIGRMFVGAFYSFLGLLILITLPYPAEMGADVIREWPYLLFFSTAVLLVMQGSENGKWYFFLLAGLVGGAGFLIRPECGLVVIFSILWLLIRSVKPYIFSRRKMAFLTLCATAGFLAVAGPHIYAAKQKLPVKLERLFVNAASNTSNRSLQKAGIGGPAAATGKLVSRLAENLNYFFIVPWVLGLGAEIKSRKYAPRKSLFIFLVIIFYTAMLLALHLRWGYISRRHCLPMIVLSFFYIPVGLDVMARFLTGPSGGQHFFGLKKDSRVCWLAVLLTLGIGLNITKGAAMFPVRSEKRAYRNIAKWLDVHTRPGAIIAYHTLSPKIGLYADRTMIQLKPRTSTLSAKEMTPNDWTHIAATYDGHRQRIYINGESVNSKDVNFTKLAKGSNNLTIGKPYVSSDDFFRGMLDDALLYDRALRPDEIRILYKADDENMKIGNQIGYWPLDNDPTQRRGRAFDGKSDMVDLSNLKLPRNLKEFTVSIWVQSPSVIGNNWIMGRGRQFRIGIRNNRVLFWIKEQPPGSLIDDHANYLILQENDPQDLPAAFNDITLEGVHQEEDVTVYKIIRNPQK